MIVAWDRLPELRGRVTMVGGGFDPLHDGHIDYIAAAAARGLPVLCNVEPDSYVATKHPLLLPQAGRVRVLDALRDVSYVHPSDASTEAVLEQLRPRYFVKGADWRGRLPAVEERVCSEHDIEVIYTDTVTNSSSALIRDFARRGGLAHPRGPRSS
jgi:bifunctional ADP-heptose synthase (sugar kinase/adenylyltransferase)